MDIRTQSSLLAAIVSVALAVSMLLRPHRAKAQTHFALLCAALTAWFLGDFLFALTGHDLWMRAAFASGAAVPAAALAFFLEFLGVSRRSARRGRAIAFVGAFGGLAVAATPLARMQPARMFVAAWVFGALAFSISLLYRRMRSTLPRIERARFAYLFVGAAAAVAASALDFLPKAGVTFPALGPIVTSLYLFFLAQTLQVYRLLDLHELFGKFAALSLLALILSSIFVSLVIWAGNATELFLFNTLIASFVILNLFEPLRAKVEGWVIATLFRERYELLQTLARLRTRLSSVIDPLELARLSLDTFHDSRRVTHASLYLLADARPGFSLIDHRGPSPISFLDASAARGVLAVARGGQKAVLLENLERRLLELRRLLGPPTRQSRVVVSPQERPRLVEEHKRLGELRSALTAMKAGICIPLLGSDRVIGFLNLCDERVPEAYSSDEIALMLEIGEQISTVVENSKLFDRMKERDRLAALGEMAAGLAHEIRNPLGAIKGAAQFLDPDRLGGEEGEFLQVIVEEVDRLNGVVTQFLDYARPLKVAVCPIDVNDAVERTLMLLRTSVPPHVEIASELDSAMPKAASDAEQLKQVLFNLVQNAVQAMPEGGRVTVSTSAPPDETSGFHLTSRAAEYVELRIRDTGPGIPEAEREHVFVPFFTTKEKGTGLGLAISQRIIRSHGGTITLQSRPGEGTEFLIRLPAVQEPKAEAPEAGSEPTPDPGPKPADPGGSRRRSRREGGRRAR
ncbi:GAF domain-containing sensor histidine kinase [Vulgatibacter incomptus]|uniref:histidine kinase n=1 Tax=Vulgatibacter incomptus TaxID=1391653 RepID=A0A0K1PCQ0_9BACT|nr:sensor histidine kinase [Vulgatibacter incomptus]AKU91277.1 Sensor protein [Vulgatibacter incomptus]